MSRPGKAGFPGKDRILEKVKPAVEAACRAHEAQLVAVDLVEESGNWFVRVTADRPGGISMQTCEKVNRTLGKELDRVDAIPFAYYLEVSSPGLSDEDAARDLMAPDLKDEPARGGSDRG